METESEKDLTRTLMLECILASLQGIALHRPSSDDRPPTRSRHEMRFYVRTECRIAVNGCNLFLFKKLKRRRAEPSIRSIQNDI